MSLLSNLKCFFKNILVNRISLLCNWMHSTVWRWNSSCHQWHVTRQPLDPIIWLFANPIILCPWYCLLSEIWNMNAEWRRTRAVQSDGGSNKKRITKVQAVGRTDLQVSEWETDLIHRGAKWITKSKGCPWVTKRARIHHLLNVLLMFCLLHK